MNQWGIKEKKMLLSQQQREDNAQRTWKKALEHKWKLHVGHLSNFQFILGKKGEVSSALHIYGKLYRKRDDYHYLLRTKGFG